jgi:hypothetical protein
MYHPKENFVNEDGILFTFTVGFWIFVCDKRRVAASAAKAARFFRSSSSLSESFLLSIFLSEKYKFDLYL